MQIKKGKRLEYLSSCLSYEILQKTENHVKFVFLLQVP